jgi:hypothetical protein
MAIQRRDVLRIMPMFKKKVAHFTLSKGVLSSGKSKVRPNNAEWKEDSHVPCKSDFW